MDRNKFAYFFRRSLLLLLLCSCQLRANQPANVKSESEGMVEQNALTEDEQTVITGDERTDVYFPILQDKRVAIFSNHTGMAGEEHILDLLIENHFQVTAIFSPEHGFRGDKDAGEKVSSSRDPQTGVPIHSLYEKGSNKPAQSSMETFDILIVDIQDVGLRFYTYYITMCHLMEACAQYGKKMLILDRPNPNGHMVDGPILDMKHKSGVGYLPVPVMHGMTLGELALMANDKGWLENACHCQIEVVPCLGYTHRTMYRLSKAPSPNLPNMKAVYLYPSLCYFEATPLSVGRGTEFPFQVYGHPRLEGDFSFTPHSTAGAKNPPLKDQECTGRDLRSLSDEEIYSQGINLEYLIEAVRNLKGKTSETLLTSFFEKLIGVDYVRRMINEGADAAQIKAMWKEDVERFKKDRKPYLLYEE